MKRIAVVAAGLAVISLLLLSMRASDADPSECPAAPLGEPTAKDATLEPVCHKGYLSMLDPTLKEARVVEYELTAAHSHGKHSRAGMSFKRDDLATPDDQGRAADYAKSGYDLGHLAPAEDFAWSGPLERETFSMANVAPQLPELNRQGWERLEETTRAEACVHGDVVIYTGPIFSSRTAHIGADKLPVPSGFFKMVIDPRTSWSLAFLVKQAPLAKGAAAKNVTSVAKVAAASGITFPLPDGVDRNAVSSPDSGALEAYRAGQCKER